MKKYIYISILSLILFFLGYISPANASVSLADTFIGGYDQTLWSVRPTYLEPVSSDFGIGDNNSTNWAILDSDTTILPDNSIVMFDMKINSEVSDVIFSCKTDFTNDQNYFNDHDLRVYLHSNGTASFDSYINGAGMGGILFNWNNSPGIHSFKLVCTNGVMTLTEDNIQLSTASFPGRDFIPSENVYFGYRFGDSEFNNYQLCDIGGCDVFPSVTPTQTPTLTPTPTPAEPRKVVVVPGMGGSWNKDALLNCKPTNYSGEWTAWEKSDAVYQPLISALGENGYDPLPFYYDWRKQVTTTAPLLGTFIQNNIPTGETTDLVAHSLGGLVSRAYLQDKQTNSRLTKLLTVGSPHQGVLLAYPAWSGGQAIGDIEWRLAATMLQIGCFLNRGLSPRQAVNTILPSVQNLLPTFDFLKNKQTGSLKPVSSMTAKNNWLPNAFTSPFFGVTVGTLTGTGVSTLKTLEVEPPSRIDQRRGNWKDGKPTGVNTFADGDGTVLAESAQLPGAEDRTLPLDHGALIYAQEGIDAIIDFLSDGWTTTSLSGLNFRQPTKPIKPKENATALLIVVEGADATLTDKNGNQTPDSEGQITILNPHDEAYTLTIDPNRHWWSWLKPKYRVIVVQLFEDGTSSWKEYPHTRLFVKKWKLRFDRKSHLSDILKDH